MRCSFEDGREKGPRLEVGRLRVGISYQVRMGNAIVGVVEECAKARKKIFDTEHTEQEHRLKPVLPELFVG
jgi:hypothetical protein